MAVLGRRCQRGRSTVRALSVVAGMMTATGGLGPLEPTAVGVMGVSQPLRLVVDQRVHAEEVRRFEGNVVRGPGGEDCAIWSSAIGADGYGRFWVRRGGTRVMVRANRYALAAALNGKALEPWVKALHGCLCIGGL